MQHKKLRVVTFLYVISYRTALHRSLLRPDIE